MTSGKAIFTIFCIFYVITCYVTRIYNCSNCFGCTMLKNKKYCILNKQYTKEEYEKLIPKIKEHMDKVPYVDKKERIYKYGEFLPSDHPLWVYNESWGNQFSPKTKEKALEEGYLWREPLKKDYKITISSEKLFDSINDVKDSILDEVIECAHSTSSGKAHKGECNEQCTTAFRVLPYELEFYRSMGLALPHLCFNCRYYQRLKIINLPRLYHRKCMCDGVESSNKEYKNTVKHFHGDKPCSNEFETAINDERKEIVYCKECYQAEFV